MLKIQEFIRENQDWRDILSKEPYMLTISEDEMFGRRLVCLKYNQIASDFSQEIVKECRGLILDADDASIVSYPFYKFFNYGEANQAEIDWSSAFVSEKLDGSIIKIVRLGDDFLISTNGVIDAFKCGLSSSVGCPFDNFGDLVLEGFKFYGISKDDFGKYFDEGYTYIFELTSPWNQVVVKWDETKVNLIGIRENSSCREIRFYDHPLSKVFNTPKIFPITNIEECVAAAQVLPDDAEGYVVCDANFNRVKVKSPKYVQLHYMAGNQTWSAARVVDIIRANEVSEYVVYFPKFKAAFDIIKSKIDTFVDGARSVKSDIDALNFGSKKDLALWLFADEGRKVYQGFAFKYYDGKVKDVDDWFDGLRTNQIVEFIGE